MQNLKQAMRSLTGFLLGLREAGIGRAGWFFFEGDGETWRLGLVTRVC